MARKMQEFAAQRWGTASSSSQAAAKACCLNFCCYIYSFIFVCCQIYIDFTTAHLCKAPPEMHSEEESILLRGPVQGCEPYPPDELAPSAALWSVFFQIRNLFSMIVHICANSLLFKINLDSCNVWGGMPPIRRHASQLCENIRWTLMRLMMKTWLIRTGSLTSLVMSWITQLSTLFVL